jgi:hypothetical protein
VREARGRKAGNRGRRCSDEGIGRIGPFATRNSFSDSIASAVTNAAAAEILSAARPPCPLWKIQTIKPIGA